MQGPERQRAIAAAVSTASALGLHADDTVVIHDSDRVAVRLLPCDVLVRVGPLPYRGDFEVEVQVARELGQIDCPIGSLDPRAAPQVYLHDVFVMSLWTYYEPVTESAIAPDDYAHALMRIHAGLRQIKVKAPRFTDQVARRQRLLAEPALTPDLSDADRELLTATLDRLSVAIGDGGTGEQLLHGEPHSGNVLHTSGGPRFIDLATCCRGPVEYDLAFTPDAVDTHYPGADLDLVVRSRALMWAMFATQRWSDADQMPDRDHWRTEGLRLVRVALARAGLDRA